MTYISAYIQCTIYFTGHIFLIFCVKKIFKQKMINKKMPVKKHSTSLKITLAIKTRFQIHKMFSTSFLSRFQVGFDFQIRIFEFGTRMAFARGRRHLSTEVYRLHSACSSTVCASMSSVRDLPRFPESAHLGAIRG